MTRVRTVLGLIAGAMLVLGSAAHSFLGWPALQGRLAAAQAPSDLVLGLKIGWLFGGVSILAFGVIVLAIFSKRFRGKSASTLPALVIAAAYLGFGFWALVASRFDPFFLVFIVPGFLLAAASFERQSRT
jgi:uncharacterized membrane protein YhaH (DUF805 family)